MGLALALAALAFLALSKRGPVAEEKKEAPKEETPKEETPLEVASNVVGVTAALVPLVVAGGKLVTGIAGTTAAGGATSASTGGSGAAEGGEAVAVLGEGVAFNNYGIGGFGGGGIAAAAYFAMTFYVIGSMMMTVASQIETLLGYNPGEVLRRQIATRVEFNKAYLSARLRGYDDTGARYIASWYVVYVCQKRYWRWMVYGNTLPSSEIGIYQSAPYSGLWQDVNHPVGRGLGMNDDGHLTFGLNHGLVHGNRQNDGRGTIYFDLSLAMLSLSATSSRDIDGRPIVKYSAGYESEFIDAQKQLLPMIGNASVMDPLVIMQYRDFPNGVNASNYGGGLSPGEITQWEGFIASDSADGSYTPNSDGSFNVKA